MPENHRKILGSNLQPSLERGGRCSPPTLGSPSTKIHYCFPLLYRCFTEPCAMPSKRKPSNTLGYRTQLLSAAGWTQLWVHVPGEKISGLNRISNDVSLMEPTALQAFRITSLLLGSTGAEEKQNTNECGVQEMTDLAIKLR